MGGKLIVFEGVEGCGKRPSSERGNGCKEERGMLLSLVNRAEQVGLVLRKLLLASVGKPIQSGAVLYMPLIGHNTLRKCSIQGLLRGQLFCAIATLIPPCLGYGRGLSQRPIATQLIATGGLESDLTLWLDVDVEVGLARTRGGGEHLTELSKRQSLFIERCSRIHRVSAS